jgi:hypothetical protein
MGDFSGMKSLIHDQIIDLTVMHAGEGIIVSINKDQSLPSDMLYVGTVLPQFANLLGAAANMYRLLDQCIKANEANLAIVEAEGLDKAAYHLQKLITAMKLIQKSAIEGPGVLTCIKAK